MSGKRKHEGAAWGGGKVFIGAKRETSQAGIGLPECNSYVYMYVHTYTHSRCIKMHTHTHTYIHTYIYTYIHKHANTQTGGLFPVPRIGPPPSSSFPSLGKDKIAPTKSQKTVWLTAMALLRRKKRSLSQTKSRCSSLTIDFHARSLAAVFLLNSRKLTQRRRRERAKVAEE